MVNNKLLLVFVVVMTIGVVNLADASECVESSENTPLASAVDTFLLNIERGLTGAPITEKTMMSSLLMS